MTESICIADMKEGIGLSENNAERLLKEAHVLSENGKHVSSFLFSQLSLEEQAKAFLLIQRQLKGRTVSKKEWARFAYFHEEKMRYIQRIIDELDAEMVKRSTGIDFWQVLKKMYQAQGDKSLENYRDTVSKDLMRFRYAKLYTDYDFEKKSWTDADQIDPAFSIRSMILAERLLEHLKSKISKLKRC
jgi:AbiV family abortive infection protein